MQDKKTLFTIIILIVLVLPLALFSTYKHFTTPIEDDIIEDDNPNKEFIYNNKLYFYLNGKLLGTYDCEACSEAIPVIDDENYHTNYYHDGLKKFDNVINDNIAIFTENGKINLFNIQSNSALVRFNDIKTYNVDHTNDVLIVKNDAFWGVISLSSMTNIIDYRYDYISIPAHFIDGKLDTSKFIAKKNSLWYIINSDGTLAYNGTRSEIVDFNDNYFVTYDNGYQIFDYNGNEYLASMNKSNVFMVGKYVFVIIGTNVLIYEKLDDAVLQTATIPQYTTISFMPSDEGVDININGNLYQTIAVK